MSDESGGFPVETARAMGVGRIHHVAFVVQRLDESLHFWRDLMGLRLELILPVPSDGVRIAFLSVGESKVELVEPVDPDTGVARFLETRGEGFHHVCFEVPDLLQALRGLADRGAELIDAAARRGAEGPVAFLHPRSTQGVLVELIEARGGPAWALLGMNDDATIR